MAAFKLWSKSTNTYIHYPHAIVFQVNITCGYGYFRLDMVSHSFIHSFSCSMCGRAVLANDGISGI